MPAVDAVICSDLSVLDGCHLQTTDCQSTFLVLKFFPLPPASCPPFSPDRSPCIVLWTDCVNHLPMFSHIETAALEFPHMFHSILICFACTTCDLKTAETTSCFLVSNAFWKSTKQWYTFWPFSVAFSATSRRIKICWTVLQSFLNPACSSAKTC